MSDGMVPGQGAPPATPTGGAPASSPQATGVGGATSPVPNRGIEAAAQARLAVHVQGIQTMLALLPAGSEMARDVREALNKLAKHVPPGAVSQGVQMSEAQRSLMQQRQMGPQIAAARAAHPAMPPGAPPAPPPAA